MNMPEHEMKHEGPPVGAREKLEGWAAVEHEMMKHDEGTMRGHIADVDTLLVFAGLFSAVLTAFVVESYQMLQADNEENSMKLLRRISIQLESFTLTPGFANSTLPAPALPSLGFVADATARWINVLWFLSLVFSLAAALFGILVKQWIREYMQWNSALANPRDNVLVRQIRFEAWNDWNVPATIASIPALLEIALVFFVCGLVILLWTLDSVVSAVITVAAAIFLAIASTFTVLPAFLRRCPYKSPTAWACAVVWDVLTRYIPYKLRTLQSQLGEWLCWGNSRIAERVGLWLLNTSGLAPRSARIERWVAVAQDWRSRDLANLWSSLLPGTERDDATPLLEHLRWERTESPADLDHKGDASLSAQLSHAQRTITELLPLIRALTWVSQACQDVRTDTNVLRCVESLERRFVLPDSLGTRRKVPFPFFDECGARALSYWHLLLDVRMKASGKELKANKRSPSVLREQLGKIRSCGGWNFPDLKALSDCSPLRENARILVYFLALSAKTLVIKLSNSSSGPGPDGQLYAANVRRFREIMVPLHALAFTMGHKLVVEDAGDCLYDAFVVIIDTVEDLRVLEYPLYHDGLLNVIYKLKSPKLMKLLDDLEIRPTSDSRLFSQEISDIIESLSDLIWQLDTSHRSQDRQPRGGTHVDEQAIQPLPLCANSGLCCQEAPQPTESSPVSSIPLSIPPSSPVHRVDPRPCTGEEPSDIIPEPSAAIVSIDPTVLSQHSSSLSCTAASPPDAPHSPLIASPNSFGQHFGGSSGSECGGGPEERNEDLPAPVIPTEEEKSTAQGQAHPSAPNLPIPPDSPRQVHACPTSEPASDTPALPLHRPSPPTTRSFPPETQHSLSPALLRGQEDVLVAPERCSDVDGDGGLSASGI